MCEAFLVLYRRALGSILQLLRHRERHNPTNCPKGQAKASGQLNSRNHGLPIYLDSTTRNVSDPAVPSGAESDWKPANKAAATLWRCLDLLRDIHEILAMASSCLDLGKQGRILKNLATPLVSLAFHVAKLCGHLATDPQWADKIPQHLRLHFEARRSELTQMQGSALRELRDKYSAHMDHNMSPDQARLLLLTVGARHYGGWLHACVTVILELLELNVYCWKSDDMPSGCFRTMQEGPLMLTWGSDEGRGTVLLGAHVASSPRQAAECICREVVAASQWLFAAGDVRLILDTK
jgi:hypothetical protein